MMMDFVLVAVLITGPGTFEVEVVQEFKTMDRCKKVLEAKAITSEKVLTFICTKKDRD